MTALAIIVLTVLLTSAAARMLTGHWMPVHSHHEPLNPLNDTIAGIPVDELGLDPQTIRDERWHLNRYQLMALWRIGTQTQPLDSAFLRIDPC